MKLIISQNCETCGMASLLQENAFLPPKGCAVSFNVGNLQEIYIEISIGF